MNGRARVAIFAAVVALFSARPALAQVIIQPTSAPAVTAENERWYLNGEPITYAGNLYYPSGAQVFFNPTEMVRSGFYQGIPLYTRPAIEPFSLVYAPLAGGRMQPYERPRSGELAGTAGSTPTTLPTPSETVPPVGLAPQAAGPLSQTAQVVPVYQPATEPAIARNDAAAASRTPVGTSGRPSPSRPPHTRIGGTPTGANAMFVVLHNVRWYPAGPAEPIETSRMVQVDTLRGFAVWAAPDAREVIYIPVVPGGTLAVRYTQVRPK